MTCLYTATLAEGAKPIAMETTRGTAASGHTDAVKIMGIGTHTGKQSGDPRTFCPTAAMEAKLHRVGF